MFVMRADESANGALRRPRLSSSAVLRPSGPRATASAMSTTTGYAAPACARARACSQLTQRAQVLHRGRPRRVRRRDRHARLRDGQDPVRDALPAARARQPVDVPSLQLQGELQSKKDMVRQYRGVLHGVGVILKNEGARGLLRGLSCAVSRARASFSLALALDSVGARAPG